MLKRILAGFGVVALAAIALPATAEAQAAEGKMQAPMGMDVTVTGTVVDIACKYAKGASGEGHRACAQACADGGVPMGILGTDGKLYILGTDTPGKGQSNKLREFAEQQVVAKGKVFHGKEASIIVVSEVSKKT